MQSQEHADTAREFLVKADRHFAESDQLQASEKLWGAVAHAVMAVAQEKGWPHTGHLELKRVAERLAVEYDDPMIAAGFGVAEMYYHDSHHGHILLGKCEWLADRPKVRDLVGRVLALRGDGG